MTGTAADVLRVAVGELGYVESTSRDHPNGNVTKYWAEMEPSMQGEPWCDAFAVWVYRHADVPATVTAWGVWNTLTAYKTAGQVVPVGKATPGCQVIFSIGQGHTGILESVDVARRTVTCIEGNTSSGVVGSQTNGGGVYRRTRPWSNVAGVGQPAMTAVAAPPAIVHVEENTMMVLDAKGPDDNGRDSHWEILKDGSVRNWNAARPLKSLKTLDPNAPAAPIVEVAADPSGDGVVMFADDAHQDPANGHWVRSTYRILVGM